MVWWHPEILVAVIWAPTAALLLRYRPGLRVGWVMLGSGVSAGVYVLALNLGPLSQLHGWAGAWLWTWLGQWLWAVDTFVLTLVLPLIFPDGRLVSRWFAPVLAAACTVPLIVCVHLTVDPEARQFHNGVSVYPFQDIPLPISATILGTLALALTSVAIRFVRSSPEVRRQIAWVVYPGVIAMAVIYVGETTPIGDVVRNVSVAGVPLCVAVAITRYRLFDIDLVISRTLVYSGLIVIITGVYFALLGMASLVAAERGRWPGSPGPSRRARCSSPRGAACRPPSTGSSTASATRTASPTGCRRSCRPPPARPAPCRWRRRPCGRRCTPRAWPSR
ncbi:hypothetical protein [Actinomadura keratinilytica]|uniref:hypothetical protein n=1 Tax=Actinomadura keratinilytica TaxID=547461 RepID=UPI00360E69E5